MPGSLLESFASKRGGHQGSVYGNGVGVTNNNSSARSDRSDGGSVHSNCSEGGSSNKKVSFNKAVRVKKYSNPPAPLTEGNFWFKVHRPSESPISSSELQPSSLHHQEAVLLPQTQEPSSLPNLPPSLQRPTSPPPPPPLPSPPPQPPPRGSSSLKSNGKQDKKVESKEPKPEESAPAIGNGKQARPLSTIIESDSAELPSNNCLNDNQEEPTMPRKESSSPISVNKSRKIINYEPYKSPPKDSTILICPEEDGFRHEWVTPSPIDKSLEFNDDNNNTKRSIADLQSARKIREKSPLAAESDIDFGKERVDDNVITIKKETKKTPLFKVMFGAKMKAVPMLPPLKNGKQSPTNKAKTITYSNDDFSNERTVLSEKKSKPLEYISDRDDRKPSPVRSKSSSPDRSALTVRRYSPVESKISSSRLEPMSKSMVEVRRSDDEFDLVEKKSPTTDVRLRDIKSEHSLANRMEPVATWESGPMLLSDSVNRESSSLYIPGEGRQMSTFEEGSKVWKHKTRRMYEEPIVGKHRSNPSPRREVIDYSQDDPDYVQRPSLKTDDDKLMVTGDKLDEIFLKKESHPLGNESDFFPYLDSYLPRMEDKACQCNLKKSKLKKASDLSDNEQSYDHGFRRIRSNRDGSVSAYSNVPSIDGDADVVDRPRRETPSRVHYHHPTKSEVIYTQVEKIKKREPTDSPSRMAYESDHHNQSEEMSDYMYEANPIRDVRSELGRSQMKRRSSPSPEVSHRLAQRQRSPSPLENKRTNKVVVSNTKTRNFASRSALDAPVIKFPNQAPWTLEEKLGKPSSRGHSRATTEPMSDDGYYVRRKIPNEKSYIASTLPRKEVNKPSKKETIEETMSISDDSMEGIKSSKKRNGKSSIHRTESMSGSKLKSSPKINDVVYENGAVVGRRAQRNGYDSASINSFNSWYKSLDEDYRKSANEPLLERSKDSRTLSRMDGKMDLKRDYSPISGRNAYTLDRRQLDARKRNKRTYYPLTGSHIGGFRSDMDADSDRVPATSNMRKYNSNRDLSMQSDVGKMSQPKSNLAAAYQARQRRASSLNRYGHDSDMAYSPSLRVHHVPIQYASHSQLNRIHYKPSNSVLSENVDPMSRSFHGGSQTRLYQNEPISLYIPAVSHHDKKADERSSGLGIGRAQSILSLSRKGKSEGTKKALKGSNVSLNEVTNKVNGYLNNNNYRSGLHDDDEIVELRDADEVSKKNKKRLIKRSQSIPKDAKLPWFQKLKMKVRS